jgi:hypothetical protein
MSLRILHVLDHSIPLHSGYTFRTLSPSCVNSASLGWDVRWRALRSSTPTRSPPSAKACAETSLRAESQQTRSPSFRTRWM